MADFNSRYTGAEIEEAIAKTDNITQIRRIYSGAPTQSVLLRSLPDKPGDGAGTWTGLYYIVYSDTATPLTTAGTKSGVSTMTIANEDGGAVGSASVGMSDTIIMSHKCKYNLGVFAGDKTITAWEYEHAFGSGTATGTQIWIHGIYRKERVAA